MSKDPFLPKSFNIFLGKLKKLFKVLFLLTVSFFLFSSFVLNDPLSISINCVSSETSVSGFLYFFNSVGSLILQVFGISSYLLSFFIIQKTTLIAFDINVKFFKTKALMLILGMLIFCLILSNVPSPKFNGMPPTNTLGGAFGVVFKNHLLYYMSNTKMFLFSCFLLGIVGFLFILFSFGISPKSIWDFLLKISTYIVDYFTNKVKERSKDIKNNIEDKIKKQKDILQITHQSSNEIVNDNQQRESINDDFDEEIKDEFEIKENDKKEEVIYLDEVYKKKNIKKDKDINYEFPSISLVTPKKIKKQASLSEGELSKISIKLQEVLEEFGVRGEIMAVKPGPVVTMFELKPAAGIKTSRVIGLADDISRAMSSVSTRIATIPGKNVIGIELPNKNRDTVYLYDILESVVYENSKSKLPIILGKDIAGQPVVADLAKMPHLLVAGTTGSGKSVSINTMILSLLYKYTPDECKMIMVDPKMLELSVYDDIPHLLTPVVTDPKKAVVALKWAVREMEERYRLMARMGVRNIDGYNARIKTALDSGEIMQRRVQTGFDKESGQPVFENQTFDLKTFPYIVIIVDEMADLMLVAGKEIEASVQRLAQMARAAGIHLITATQRPSVDVITGTIKANFPTRVSFMVSSKIDSRTILGEQGAEQLLGQGDMLYMASGGRVKRVHGPFCSDEQVESVVDHLKSQGQPQYVDDVTEGENISILEKAVIEGSDKNTDLYNRAIEIVMLENKASTSFVQRHLQIGYNRAAKIIEQMEKEGIISAANHVGKREVLKKA